MIQLKRNDYEWLKMLLEIELSFGPSGALGTGDAETMNKIREGRAKNILGKINAHLNNPAWK